MGMTITKFHAGKNFWNEETENIEQCGNCVNYESDTEFVGHCSKTGEKSISRKEPRCTTEGYFSSNELLKSMPVEFQEQFKQAIKEKV